ncbi:PREDICTED: LOW QUALITY PROTEIN: mas-related G-protein coupled receptor member X2-like [Chinchilla lanigera]|uniref:LOW QUALITY PROTEIN: mas-related G-protein coupled receptor member X2-like n=1 Tax=Chinchilla lanigera TaxID=34839 RepID=UPI000695C42D|nr:PREDICTED: LOW QUALITY PROTEIN: mas-related G-protein coupled receptor member X2-like [Chinchilla lanigera]
MELRKTNGSFLVIMHSFVLIIGLAGLAGNAVVLWLLGFRMRRNAIRSIYIFSLAGANFVFLCNQVILSVTYFFHTFCFTSSSGAPELLPVLLCSYFTGLSMFSAVSAEHSLSVLWPIRKLRYRPRHMSAISCAFLWIFSLLLGILFMDTFVVFSGSSLALLVRTLAGSRQFPMTRLNVAVRLMVLFFLLCGLPIGTNLLVVSWFVNTSDPDYYGIIALALSCINSSTAPITYFFVVSFRKHRQSLQLALERVLQNVAEEDKSGERLQDSVEMSEYLYFSDSESASVHSQK